MISGGRYQPYVDIVINGQVPLIQTYSGLAQLGFYAGLAGCPNPLPSGDIDADASVSGCLAIPVPAGLNISSIGFDLSNESGGAGNDVALWSP